MSAFKWRQFAGEVILWAVRWYCRYGISYLELEEMLGERGVAVDHTTIYRWVQRYSERRSAMAKQIGFGRHRAPAEPPAAPRRRGRPRRSATTVTFIVMRASASSDAAATRWQGRA
jgi:transposase